MRLRCTYSKGDRVRFLGHLDVYRVIRMALQRAGWPVAMSQGFSPKPKISLYSPLPVGTAGLNEIFDVDLSQRRTLDALARSLSSQMPNGFSLTGLREISEREASLEPRIRRSLYYANLGPVDQESLRQALSDFEREERVLFEIQRPKETKVVDIRPFFIGAEIISKAQGDHARSCAPSDIILSMQLGHDDGKTIRPAWVLTALDRYGFKFDPREAIIDRRKILFDD